MHTYRRSADVLVNARDLEVADSVAISRSEFVQGIRAATETTACDDFAVLFVHKFGTSHSECVRYTAESRIRWRSGVSWVAFCWPSNGTGFAPPSRGAILDRADRSDSAVAVESQPAFGRAAGVMLDALPASRLMLVSHSLGAQLMAGALRESTVLRQRSAREDARAIVFAAPDFDRDRFADSVVSRLQSLTERFVLYTSGHDRMLTLGRARSGAVRAGQRRDAPLAHPTLDTVDATESLSAKNRFAQIFGTHHALQRASSVLFDMIYVAGARGAPECRVAPGTGTWRAQTGLELTPQCPGTQEIDARCATGIRKRH